MVNFVKYQFIAFLVSFSIIFGIFGIILYKIQTTGQAFNYSIDFTGGSQFLFKFENPIKPLEILSILQKNNIEGSETREFSPTEILVKVKQETAEVAKLAREIMGYIKAEIPDNKVEVLQSDSIGAGIGKELRAKSINAILIVLLLLLVYIVLRFWSLGFTLGFGFALGAIIALFHDAILIFGVFLITGKEISLNVIGAILAVLGYSINDTIVIFTQIRKNISKMTGRAIGDIVDASLNQMLKRTLLTSFSTALVVAVLFFLGGVGLRDFSMALLIGIVFGTYSSMYIASPIMMLFYKNSSK